MSLEFLASDAAVSHDGRRPDARSPMERLARAAGARFESRDGWSVAVSYRSSGAEAWQECAGWADTSCLGKLEIQALREDLAAVAARCAGRARLELGRAARLTDAWWCPLTGHRALVLCEPSTLASRRRELEEAAAAAAGPTSVVEVTTGLAALTLVGPLAREVLARFTSIDVRPQALPVGGLRPGSIARQPGVLLREDADRYLLLFGWAVAEYMWTVVADAATHAGGAPIGVDELAHVEAALGEAASRA